MEFLSEDNTDAENLAIVKRNIKLLRSPVQFKGDYKVAGPSPKLLDWFLYAEEYFESQIEKKQHRLN